MKNYENCPVNEWNAAATRLGYETVLPWDVVRPKSSGSKETVTEDLLDEKLALTQIDNDSSGVTKRGLQHESIATV